SVAVVLLLRRSTAGHGGGLFASLGGWVERRRTPVRLGTAALVVVLAVTFGVAGLPALSADPAQLRAPDDPPTLAIRRLAERFPDRMLPDLVAWRGTDLDRGLTALHEARRAVRDAGGAADWSGPGTLVPDRERQVRILGLLAAFPRDGFAARAAAALRAEGLNPVPFAPAIEKLASALAVKRPLAGADLRSPALRPLARRFLVEPGGESILVAYHRAPEGSRAAIASALAESDRPVVATGPRALLEGIASNVEAEFRLIPLLVLAAVLAATAVGFRSLRLALLSIAPVVLGMAMTLGAMSWSGLTFNMINIGLIPMVLGLGVDDGIQFMNRLRHERGRPVAETARHVGGAILLTTLTTCAAFGSLVLSTSPGLASMGYLVMLGALSCCAVTLLVLPALLPARRKS
ncbi:MAG: MMPL family transporter, partial [Planctomycetota bacterium]